MSIITIINITLVFVYTYVYRFAPFYIQYSVVKVLLYPQLV